MKFALCISRISIDPHVGNFWTISECWMMYIAKHLETYNLCINWRSE